jgi:biopolymer transport protein ExbD
VKFRRRQRGHLQLTRLPLVALIDVVLFMLFYFMMAGTFGGEEARLAAASAIDRPGGGAATGALSSQTVRVEPEGGAAGAGGIVFKLGSRVVRDRAELVALLRQLPKEPGVVIRAADAVPVEAAAAALQAAHDAGFNRVSYVGTR